MTRDGTFVRLGRMIERADKTSRMLDVRYLFFAARRPVGGTPLRRYSLGGTAEVPPVALQMYRKNGHRPNPARNALGRFSWFST